MKTMIMVLAMLVGSGSLHAEEAISCPAPPAKLKPSDRIAQLEEGLLAAQNSERIMTKEAADCKDALADKRRLVDSCDKDMGRVRDELAKAQAKLMALENDNRTLKTELADMTGRNQFIEAVMAVVTAIGALGLAVIAVFMFFIYRKLWPKKAKPNIPIR